MLNPLNGEPAAISQRAEAYLDAASHFITLDSSIDESVADRLGFSVSAAPQYQMGGLTYSGETLLKRLIVSHIEPGSWAYKEGWHLGDEIVRFNSTRLPEDKALISTEEIINFCAMRPLTI